MGQEARDGGDDAEGREEEEEQEEERGFRKGVRLGEGGSVMELEGEATGAEGGG